MKQKQRKTTVTKLTPSQLVKKQLTGNGFFDQAFQKPRIIQFLNLADYSINTQSYVNIDEPLFQAIPPVICFSDYQPLQLKQKVFKLRNKDRFSRRVKIIQPDSKLFQILLPTDQKNNKIQSGTKVAAGMETKFIVKFSPEAKIDYKYQLIVVTERQKFIVPIYAIGKRAMIDFPDILDFGACPVKFSTQKPVIIRNLGEKTTKWALELPQGFNSNQKEGVLQPGKNQQIVVKFYPLQAKLYRSAAKLQYDKLAAYVELVGSGQLSNVYLSRTVISMQQSYIGLQSQQTVHIVNKSNVKVSFQWRAFSSQKQQKPKKQLLYQQLQEQEAQQLMLLREVINSSQKNQQQENNIDDSSSQEQFDRRQYLERKRKRAELSLARKYQTIRKAIEDDLFLFQDQIFKIQPLVGEIWPNSEITITVTFMPVTASTYDCMAYCNISCAQQRLPLKIKGQGLGPKAYLTQQQINFGDIFVNQPIKQTIQIENRGQIPCHFTLQKPQRAFAKMFDFSVQERTLDVGQNCSFQIRFRSSIPGQFKQKFRWQLHGSQRNLQMTFLGHVIAPTFQFVDPNDSLKVKPQINFGKVSYDFEYKQGIILKNTSSVQFTYNLKILSENKILQNEFRIHPQSGTIAQKSQKLIQIEFNPKSIKKYQTVMTIDIQGVGNDMLSVPIKADCQIPIVQITPSQKIQFTQACLNYPQTRLIQIKNNSDLKAKFNIVPQSQQSKVLAKYTVVPEFGVIDQRESKQLQITLITCKLGQITLPLYVNIVGTNNNQASLLNICANSDGPKVSVTPQQLDFGQVQVLKDYNMKITIVNNSKIKAEFHAFTRQKISIFKPKIKHAFLQPGQKLQFDVVCNADDASKFNDILHFVVKDGKDKDIILKAKGIGSTIYCQQDLQHLDFGNIYTYKTAVKEIFIQNRGRKSQKITWQRKKIVDKKKSKEEQQKQQQVVFTIDPQTQTIPPKYGRYFKFVAMSQKKGKISEQFLLMSQVGNERKANQLKALNIQGQFTQPNVIYSEKKIIFKYIWQKNVPIQPLQKEIILTSGASLPMSFNLKTALPFSISQQNHFLQPGATTKVKVYFDPNFKTDKISGVLNGKINVIFPQHPHRQTVQLVGQLSFPNLKIQTSIVNFGAILNDTTKKISIFMKNISQMPVTYQWAFLQDQVLGQEQKMNMSSNSLLQQNSTPINQIFDILPFSGKLDADQVQQVQFIYNAQGGILYRATAVCHIEGGPNYQIKLQGDSSLISGKISQKELDFGQLRFCEWATKQIYLQNTGKVTYEYKVDMENVKRKAFLDISPMQGKIAGGQKQKITIKICPTMPQKFQQQFEIQMGYFDPETIKIVGSGVYPSLICQFPRSQGNKFDQKIKQQLQRFAKQHQALLKKTSKQKIKKKQTKSIEQYKQQLQKQYDRVLYCELIEKQITSYIKPQKPPANNLQSKLFQNVYLTNWLCDFGNVIIGTTQKRILKFKNIGQYPIQMSFDTKIIKSTDYKITPQKSKLAPGQQIAINVTLVTKRLSKPGKMKSSVILQVKTGAKYKLQLFSNLTVPQIVIDSNSEGVVDFGKVLCGQRKIITLRFLNQKEVSCDWALNFRDPVGGDKQQLKFQIIPSFGKIASGSFQIVQAIFFPHIQKDFTAKFPIKIQQNPKILNIQFKGIGTSINIQAHPQRITIGPVFPYNQIAYSYLHIINPTKYATQLISLDFDKRFKKDIQTLSMYQNIKNSADRDKKNAVFLPIRQAGSKIWPEVIRDVQKYQKIQELKKKITEANQAQKTELQKQIGKFNQAQQVVNYPKKVTTQNILHLILYGPPKSGKSHVALTINNLFKKAIINIDQVIDWHINMGTQLGKQITQFLDKRKKQLQLALSQRQKAFKKAAKKAKQLQDKLGPANQQTYEYLSQQMWVKAIQQRIKHPECGAGCIFDNLKSKHIESEQMAISMIFKALGNQNINLIIFENDELENIQKSQLRSQTEKTSQKIQQPSFVYNDFSDTNLKNSYLEKLELITKLCKNQLQNDKIPTIKLFKDPVFGQSSQQVIVSPYLTHLGNRDILNFPIKTIISQQDKQVSDLIPAPIYPDPMTEPIPQPKYQQIIYKFTGKIFQSKVLKQFSLWTAKDKYMPYVKLQKKQDKKSKTRKDRNNQTEPKVEFIPVQQQLTIESFSSEQTRWVIPPETTLKLLVKFYSKNQGTYDSLLTFENTFNLKRLSVPIRGKTQFPSLSPLPKNIFNSIKKKRPIGLPDCYLSKVFVQSQNQYDFGPLLIGKNHEKKNEKDMINVNSTVFKFLNSGPFKAEIQFAFLSSVMQNNPIYNKNVFSLSTQRMQIQPGNTPKQLRLWAIPLQAREFKDQLIVMIKNNPNPLVLPIRCMGSKPSIQVFQGSPMVFTRILLNQVIKRQLKFRNTSAVPVKYKLLDVQNLPKQFSINIKQGKLKPNEQTQIQVSFKAIQQQKFNQVIKLISEDLQNMNLTSPPIDIPIQAQAFDISVDLKFPPESQQNMLDFGSLRVGDFVDKSFNVKNIGLYKVKLSFTMKKKLYKQSFKIEPMQFQLQPNANKDVLIRFSSLKQVKLKTNSNTTDIFMEILQGKTMQTHKSIPINVNVNSVFSNYSIVPLKNMNFGPIQFNQSKIRTFQIKNQGLFEFNYSIFDNSNEQFRKQLLQNIQKQRDSKLQAANNLSSAIISNDKGGKGAPKKDAKQVKKDAKKAGKGAKQEVGLKIGQWNINPISGSVAPDSSAIIQVNFSGKGQALFQQKIAIDVQNRNPIDQPNGIIYEFVAQSCIPGINTQNFDAIFQQQLVLASQQHSTNVMKQIKSNVFFVEERLFNFGTLVPSKEPQGIVERIKIENTNKVPCNMKFQVKKKTQNAIQQFAFDVEPKQAKIPPHQHQYVKLIFNPTIMASYAGMFTAIVDNGESQPKTHKLMFDLKGEGALPTLKVQYPSDYSDQRTILLKFPKTRIGKTHTQAIKLKNQGSIPATAKFELTANDNFRFLDSNTASLTPKSYGAFMIMFEPRQPGVKVWQITCQTLLNQYECMRFKIQGQAYYQDILFENLPSQQQQKINFDDCVINEVKRFTFSLRNNAIKSVKFNWANHQNFSFKPNIGHLNSKTSKAISISFKSSKTVQLKDIILNCETIQINQNNQQFVDWDNSMTITKFITKTQFDWYQKKKEEQRKKKQQQAQLAKKGAKKDAKKAPKKQQVVTKQQCPKPPADEQANIPFQQVISQPENGEIEKTQKVLSLKASAIADYAKYTISQKIIDFHPTMMYTSRSHRVSLKNTSTVKLNYNCKIVSSETGKIDTGFFSVSPHSGTILPNCEESFTIKFSPTEVQDFIKRLLSISIKNLDPQTEKLILEIDGQVQRPICHFELAPSKYRQKNPDIQAKYNILQYQSLGTKVKNTKRFYVINPTSLAYDFQWKKIQHDKDNNSGFFRCSTTKGTILSGKKTQMIFQYTPDLIGSHQSYWTFQIPSQNIIQYFLIVGQVVEPNVFFDTGKINFGPLLIGGKNKQIVTLKNLQDVPLAFNFQKQSIKGQMQWGNSLSIQPMSGVISSQGQLKIEVLFQPKVSQSFNYNVVCNVKRRSQPVCLNVKGIGYILEHSIYLDNRPNPIPKNQKQQINYGNIFINQVKQKKITIQNNGDFNFDFSIKQNSLFPFLKLSHEFGTVKKNQKFSLTLTFQPTDQFAFKVNSCIMLNIISGPTYTFLLRGTSKKPGIDFSFFDFDFGPCFVLKQPLPVTTYLQIRNRQNVAMNVESLYQKSDYLDVKIPSGQVVLPFQLTQIKNKKGIREKVQKNLLRIPIVFTPRENIKYSQELVFDINGLNKIIVKVRGQGIPLKLQLEKIQDQNVDFGVIKVGGQSHRFVNLINNSKKQIQISFDVQNQIQNLNKSFLSIIPSTKISINPRQKYALELIYRPTIRMSNFKMDILYEIVQNKEKKKLMNVSACSHGIQMKLMQDTIGFGTVVVNSKIIKTIQLSNFGDIGSKFQWDTTFCSKYFTITPQKGYLIPHQDLLFNVTFHPNVADNDIRFKIKCKIEGSDQPLYVNLVGKCIPQPADTIQELKFNCFVRDQNKQKITLKNTTNKPWNIKTSISSEQSLNYFSGKQMLQVAAGASIDYEVFYRPLTMTKTEQVPQIKTQTHEASLFFPIPDGTALMYKLIGTAKPASSLKTFDLTCKAKQNLVQIIPIKNWMKTAQRFNVDWKFDVEQKSVFINAATIFDIAGDSLKDFKLSIYTLKACQVKFTLWLRNPVSYEFISYRVNLNVSPSQPLKQIKLVSLVRQTSNKLITIQNPLQIPVQIKKQMIIIQSDVLYVQPNNFLIPAKSQFGFQVIFRPLIAKQQNTKIQIKSLQLGDFIYPLKLIGSPSTSSRNLNFKTSLGSEQTQKFKFIHYGKKQTTYNCRIQKVGQKAPVNVDPKAKQPVVISDFALESPTVIVPASDSLDGVQALVNIKFQPSTMSQSISQLVISSPDAGQYVCILNGYASLPQPKGPFKITANKPPPIDFKNPFFEACQFIVRIDNPSFTSAVKSPVKVDGKKVLSINLTYKAVPNTPPNGRLTISTSDNLTWVYYLQGQ